MKACKKCKSTNVVVRQWVDVNEPVLPDLNSLSTHDTWCMKCDDYTRLIDVPVEDLLESLADSVPEDVEWGPTWSEAIDQALAPLVDKLKRMNTQVKSHVNGFSVIQRNMLIYEDATLGGAVEFVKNMKESV